MYTEALTEKTGGILHRDLRKFLYYFVPFCPDAYKPVCKFTYSYNVISLGDSTLSFCSGSQHFVTMYMLVYLFGPRGATLILQLITMIKQIHNDKSHHADS